MGSTTVGEVDIFTPLREALEAPGTVLLTPDEPGYEDSIKRWSDTCIKRAAAVTKPTTASEVSTIVKFAAEKRIPFVVRGGGHSSSSASAIEDGIVIDLSLMRGVTVDPAAKTITAQGGTLWEDVDLAAAKHGLAAVGGTVNNTGVGGLTLGGGYGWLTGRYGLVIDNLLSVQVVLADGKVVPASKDENSDLFWAIRGAGQCFGVVTEFVFQGYDQGDVWAGLMLFTPDRLAAIVEFANWFHEKADMDQGFFFGWTTPPGAPSPMILAVPFFNGSKEAAERFFAPLIELKPVVDQTGSMPYEKLNSMLPSTGFGGRMLMGGSTVTIPLDRKFVQDIADQVLQFVDTHEKSGESIVAFELVPHKKLRELSNDATAFANRGDYYNFVSVWKYEDPSLDAEIREWNRSFNGNIRKFGDRKNEEGVGQYSQFAPYKARPEVLFGQNAGKLLELKRKYDPDNLFNKWHDLLAASNAISSVP